VISESRNATVIRWLKVPEKVIRKDKKKMISKELRNSEMYKYFITQFEKDCEGGADDTDRIRANGRKSI
jgi:hypothetical protein